MGEIRIDEETGECLMLMRDNEGKRVSLKVSLTEQTESKQGILTETSKKNGLKLRSLVTHSMACVPKNYKVRDTEKTGFFRDEQVTIAKVDIGLHEQMRPYVYELRENNSDSDDN